MGTYRELSLLIGATGAKSDAYGAGIHCPKHPGRGSERSDPLGRSCVIVDILLRRDPIYGRDGIKRCAFQT